MEIIRADVMGVCFGVRRAIELAEAALGDADTVNTLGPLVHSPQETARLHAEGIHVVETPDTVKGGTVVIRAHGSPPEIFERLRQRNLRIIDATCPFVKISQRIAKEFAAQEYTLVIVGHPDHPEVQGILGYIESPAYVISHPDEVATLPATIRPGVIAQTTVNEQRFLEVVEAIKRRFPVYAIRDTVCSATRERQQAARRLAAQVDIVFVVGGRHSSNSNRLAEICGQVCRKSFLIETAEEIIADNLKGVTRVGVTAGASTPDWLIDQVVDRLQEISAG